MLEQTVYHSNWMQNFTWTVYVGFILAFLVAFGLGANDCANSYGTVVGARVLKLWQAYILATVFELLGAGLLGYRVTETLRNNIVNATIYNIYVNGTLHLVENCNLTGTTMTTENLSGYFNDTTVVQFEDSTDLANTRCVTYTSSQFLLGELGALAGTAFWLIFATIFLLPVSTTHSAVGATVGFSLVLRGMDGIYWWTIFRIVLSWVVSPLAAGSVSICFYLIIKFTVLRRKDPFEASLQMFPVFMFFTITVNLFSVLYEGSKYLYFDRLPWWACLLISLGLGTISALIVVVWGRKLIRDRVLILSARELTSNPHDNILSDELESVRQKSKKSKKSEKSDISSHSVEMTSSPMESDRNKQDAGAIGSTKQTGDTPEDSDKNRAKPNELKQRLKNLKAPIHENPLAAQVFNYLQIMSACFLSFSHGSNDVANAVGPLVGLWATYKNGHAINNEAATDMSMQYLIMFGAISMIVGLWILGHKVIKTIGTKITTVTPPSGFAMEIGTAFTVLICSKLGIPISTTHCAVGAVVCVGWVKSHEGGVSWKTFRNIAAAWVITLPVTCAVAAFIAWLLVYTV